jgi:predicted XRE-type DNA-binding protein
MAGAATKSKVKPPADPLADIEVYRGSDNVFEDIGVKNPDESLAKSILFQAIAQIVRDRGLTQAAAAELCDIDQPKMSKILRAKLYGISVEQLMDVLLSLGCDVEIVIHREDVRRRRRGRLTALIESAD